MNADGEFVPLANCREVASFDFVGDGCTVRLTAKLIYQSWEIADLIGCQSTLGKKLQRGRVPGVNRAGSEGLLKVVDRFIEHR